jgi:hypothetical protein
MRTVYVQQLLDSKPNNFSQTKKEWEDEIYSYLVSNTSRSWSRGGITMMFGQLIVNSPDRVKLGSLRDMFIELPNKTYRKYISEEDSSLPHYYYDRSKTNVNREKQQTIDLDSFMNGYVGKGVDDYKVIPTQQKVLILTQCGKKKTIKSGSIRAGEMYHGNQTQILDKTNSDFYILSAKYGWVNRNEVLDYYDQTFNSLSKEDLISFSQKTNLRGVLDKIIEENKYDLVIYCLGETYLQTLQIDKSFLNTKHLFLLNKTSKLKPTGDVFICNITPQMTLLHGDSQINIKGRIIADLDKHLNGDWDSIINNPNLTQTFSETRTT